MEKLVEEGEVCHVAIEGLKTAPLYMLPGYKNKKIRLSDDAFILSPFERKYGYFSLLILAGDTFVARMDSKADRKQRVLTVHNLHFEPLKLSKPMIVKIINAIKTFAKFNQCQDIIIKKSNDKALSNAIREQI